MKLYSLVIKRPKSKQCKNLRRNFSGEDIQIPNDALQDVQIIRHEEVKAKTITRYISLDRVDR